MWAILKALKYFWYRRDMFYINHQWWLETKIPNDFSKIQCSSYLCFVQAQSIKQYLFYHSHRFYGSGIQEQCSGEVFFLLHVSETSAQEPQIAGGDQIPGVGITQQAWLLDWHNFKAGLCWGCWLEHLPMALACGLDFFLHDGRIFSGSIIQGPNITGGTGGCWMCFPGQDFCHSLLAVSESLRPAQIQGGRQ